MEAYKVKIKELPALNKSHLAWRLDNKTFCGYVTACNIARCSGEWGDKSLYDIFVLFGCSPHSAKIHSKKVLNFTIHN